MRTSIRASATVAPPSVVQVVARPEARHLALRRFLRNRSAVVGGAVIVALCSAAVLAPWVAPQDPLAMDMARRLQGPSAVHLLGTDEFGRDLLSRLIWGARLSLAVGAASVGMAMVLGATLGLVSGFFGGWVDLLIMRVVDVFLAFPAILLALTFVAALGSNERNVTIALGLIFWTTYARLVRASTLSLRQEEYVLAARVLGAGPIRILLRHVLPNLLGPVIVVGTLGLGVAITSEAALSFLGLGAQPPTPSWGATLTFGLQYLRQDPWLSTATGLAIMLTVLGFNLLGDGLRDLLDPRQSAD
jgi:peptide/nickel transport system permease protein